MGKGSKPLQAPESPGGSRNPGTHLMAPTLLAYLHEDFAQRYKRSAQLCREDAAHEEISKLSPEVLQITTLMNTGPSPLWHISYKGIC